MELLYLWVEKYNNIEKQGFNFSSKYKFDFDYEKKELTCEENQNCLGEGFFGDNITNITAIIGKNGSGKSSVLELLANLLRIKNQGENINKRVIIIFRDVDSKIMYKDKNIKIKNSIKKFDITETDNINEVNYGIKNFMSIFYSNSDEKYDILNEDGIVRLMTEGNNLEQKKIKFIIEENSYYLNKIQGEFIVKLKDITNIGKFKKLIYTFDIEEEIKKIGKICMYIWE